MVTVPHIAVASYPDALPFIYGIRHAPDFRVGELLAATPERCAELFAERETDLALVPAALVPDLHDADIVTEYCVGATGPSRSALLLSNDPPRELRRLFLDPQSPTAAHLAAYLLGKRWGLTPNMSRSTTPSCSSASKRATASCWAEARPPTPRGSSPT